MSKIYIAGPLYAAKKAREIAVELRERDHEIVSAWHDDEKATAEAEAKLSHGDLQSVGWACVREINQASTMVVVYDAPGGRFGHVWEAGYFTGRHTGRNVIAVPFNEHSSVPCVFLHSHALLLPGVDELLGYLS